MEFVYIPAKQKVLDKQSFEKLAGAICGKFNEVELESYDEMSDINRKVFEKFYLLLQRDKGRNVIRRKSL